LFLYSNDAYFKRRATLFSIEIRSAQRWNIF
jgi:hypothetical protein